MMMTDRPRSNTALVCNVPPPCPQLSTFNPTMASMQPPADFFGTKMPLGSTKRAAHEAGGSLEMRNSRKRVRFEELSNAIIPQQEDISVSTSWYQTDDYRSFQLEARNTIIAHFYAGNDPFLLDPSQHCLRGLEKHQFPPHVRALYKAQNRQFVRLIIREYARLREAQVVDAEIHLQYVSNLYTHPARTYAMHLALSDAD